MDIQKWLKNNTTDLQGQVVVMTGAAGGVFRDVFINEEPLIFRKEIYAMACVLGGVAYWLCGLSGIDAYICQVISGIVVFTTRILAVKYNVCLPVLRGESID